MATSSKTPTIKEIEKRLDTLVQTVQRAEGCKLIDGEWKSKCVTCGRVLPIAGKNCMQGGHFIPRGCKSTRWIAANVHPQCLTKESFLHLTNGDYKSIKDIEPGDTVDAFDDRSLERVGATVKSVDSFMPEHLYEVVTEDGNVFFATGDHMVMTTRGWVTVDDMLHNCSDVDIIEL